MSASHRRSWLVVTAGVLLGQLGVGARAQEVTADRLVLAPTTTSVDGVVYRAGEPLFHTWDPAASLGETKNLFFGRRSGNILDLPNNTARYNTGFGYEVLHDVTTGGGNTAVGAAAMRSVSVGGNNTAVGAFALSQTTSGESNTAIGNSSLGFNTTGSYNVSVGGLSYSTTGSYNTAVGAASLFQSTTGWENTALGSGALLGNRVGSSNTALGYQADVAKVARVLGDGYNVVARSDDADALLSMRYTDLIAPLVRALQEVDGGNRSRDDSLAALRAENLALRGQVEALQARLEEQQAESRARLDRLERELGARWAASAR